MQIPLPESLKRAIGDARWERVDEGESGAEVWRLTGETIRYLKLNARDAQYSVLAEKQRLDYLTGRIPAPKVLHYAEDARHQFLLMEGLEGLHPMHDDLDWTSEERIAFLAQALRRFHALPLEDCPFRASISQQLERARENLQNGDIREDLLEPENQGRDLWELYAELEAMRPASEDWVVTHGDSYPMNIIAEPKSKALLGFIDVGGVAVAERYTDFAPIANAIGWHLGEAGISRFFDLYGLEPDWDKLRFYQLLDEFY